MFYTYLKEKLQMNVNSVDLYASKILEEENAEKKVIIDKIKALIKPLLNPSGYIDESNYVNGFLPKGEERKYIGMAHFPEKIIIPSCLVEKDISISHHTAEEDLSFNIEYLTNDGIYLEYCSFSNYYDHDIAILKVILYQLGFIL